MTLFVVGAALIRDGRCLVAQRGATMSAPELWEFPGGKVEPGEDPRAALRRELAEELGIDAEIGEHAGRGEALVGGERIVLDVYFAKVAQGEPRPLEHRAVVWLDANGLGGLEWAAPDIPVVARVAARLRSRSKALTRRA